MSYNLNVTENGVSLINSALPGIPEQNIGGAISYFGIAIYNYESTLSDIEKGVELVKRMTHNLGEYLKQEKDND